MNALNIRNGFVKVLLLCFATTLFFSPAAADEGMWLISLVGKNMSEMQRMGLKLSAEDIYSINSSCIKDAVVQLDDGGCTAELISANGLILTNHHCAVGDIQLHSSVGSNLLRDGFWAASYKDELPVPGKTALILKRVEDVTDRVLSSVDYSNEYFFGVTDSISEAIAEEAMTKEKGVYAKVVPMFNQNQFFLFVYHRFTDVRLVGAPPASIGNFGGDIDNWRWPRHTGDFALFRIYADSKGIPAEYSQKNVPYKPMHHFPISLEGVAEDDFTMVVGYPGTTHRLSTSFHAKHERDVVAPWVDNVWGQFIGSIKAAMSSDMNMKVNLTDKHDMLVNFWQKDTYQAQSMHRFDVVNRMAQREAELVTWGSTMNQPEKTVSKPVAEIERYYTLLQQNKYEEQLRSISSLVSWPIEIADRIYDAHDLIVELMAEKPSKARIKREVKKVRKGIETSYSKYFEGLDRQLYEAAMASFVKSLPDSVDNDLFSELKKQANLDIVLPAIVSHFYQNSFFSSPENLEKFLAKPSLDSLANDPLFLVQLNLESYFSALSDSIEPHMRRYELARRDFTKGLLEMYSDRLLYPDANSTMRLSYGKVIGYSPLDGIKYGYATTLDGMISKEKSEVDVFQVSPRMKSLWQNKDFGRYTNGNTVPVCFLTDNDITNGNSGSPVLNAKGQLVGVAFDGNWEAMACDFMFEPSMQRTIVTDIRYVLFVIEKFAGANRLIEEMTILESAKN